MTKNLVPLIRKAKSGDEEAMVKLHNSFKPLFLKYSFDSNRRMNQDCFQELSLHFILAVHAFDIDKYRKK